MRTSTRILFIDRLAYDNLVCDSNTGSLKQQLDILSDSDYYGDSQLKLSDLTIKLVRFYNYYFNTVFHCNYSNTLNSSYGWSTSLNNREKEYAQSLFREDYILNPPSGNIKKYYEIQMLPDGDQLVIFEKGFVYYLAELKDNLKKFVLDCLCAYYGYGLFSDSSSSKDISVGINRSQLTYGRRDTAVVGLVKFYIALLENDNSFTYFKSMI